MGRRRLASTLLNSKQTGHYWCAAALDNIRRHCGQQRNWLSPKPNSWSKTAALLGVSLAQLVKAGTLVYAKREFLNHKKYSGGDSEALLRSGSGVADARIQAAYESLATANVPGR